MVAISRENKIKSYHKLSCFNILCQFHFSMHSSSNFSNDHVFVDNFVARCRVVVFVDCICHDNVVGILNWWWRWWAGGWWCGWVFWEGELAYAPCNTARCVVVFTLCWQIFGATERASLFSGGGRVSRFAWDKTVSASPWRQGMAGEEHWQPVLLTGLSAVWYTCSSLWEICWCWLLWKAGNVSGRLLHQLLRKEEERGSKGVVTPFRRSHLFSGVKLEFSNLVCFVLAFPFQKTDGNRRT